MCMCHLSLPFLLLLGHREIGFRPLMQWGNIGNITDFTRLTRFASHSVSLTSFVTVLRSDEIQAQAAQHVC
ncbi:hypothetical protein FPQ18DRAFT_317554 [Pyronema domesticum]|nr:hypothetical protein FPQ18DRAFT_317554 [Pyronema domesticum]